MLRSILRKIAILSLALGVLAGGALSLAHASAGMPAMAAAPSDDGMTRDMPCKDFAPACSDGFTCTMTCLTAASVVSIRLAVADWAGVLVEGLVDDRLRVRAIRPEPYPPRA
jgi:hypothetical protein